MRMSHHQQPAAAEEDHGGGAASPFSAIDPLQSFRDTLVARAESPTLSTWASPNFPFTSPSEPLEPVGLLPISVLRELNR